MQLGFCKYTKRQKAATRSFTFANLLLRMFKVKAGGNRQQEQDHWNWAIDLCAEMHELDEYMLAHHRIWSTQISK